MSLTPPSSPAPFISPFCLPPLPSPYQVREDLLGLVSGLASLPGLETLAMTTNGIKLQRGLPDLQRAGGAGGNENNMDGVGKGE